MVYVTAFYICVNLCAIKRECGIAIKDMAS